MIKTIIGLEVHVQLNSKSKMFCGCDNESDGKKPNTNICPICLGMPGTLPVPNIDAIEKTVMLGLALGCDIAEISKFDRKHYFYPDLPKGYQISQYDMPFCKGGEFSFEVEGVLNTVKLNRAHLEEDAGKLIHVDGSKDSYVDLNRAGTPLLEIVTEPDLTSPQAAREFLKALQKLLRTIGVSRADMEKGHLRCDANISVNDRTKSSPIVEIKNLNSFKFVEKALALEDARLRKDFESFSGSESKSTRGFDAKKSQTYSLREKEEAKDYRYFPEPDLPPFEVSKIFDLDKIRASLPELPGKIEADMMAMGLHKHEAELVAKKPAAAAKVKEVLAKQSDLAADVAKLILNDQKAFELSIDQLIDLATMSKREAVSSNLIREIISEIKDDSTSVREVFAQISSSDSGELDEVVGRVIRANPEAVDKYKSGKTQIIGFLIGQVMREVKGINPNEVKKIIEEKLKDI